MKAFWSSAWKRSTQPRKQRKYRFNIPMHLRSKLLSVHLSPQLREKHNTRAVGVRVGDKVRVMRGTHKGKEGTVERVDAKNYQVYVMKVEHAKKEGGSASYPLSPSNLMLIELKNEKRRFKSNEKSDTKK